MEKIRSRGVAFWGNVFVILGILYGVVNSARNIWRLDYVGLPILYVVIGIGILGLKNWARITALVIAALLILSGILDFPTWMRSINEMAHTGKGWFAISVFFFIFRFVVGLGTILFFLRPSVKEQFKKGAKV